MDIKKEKLELEYIINGSKSALFKRLSTASGLSEWFADNVDVNDNIYTFTWDKSEQSAELLENVNNSRIKFRWEDDDEDYYFQFLIRQDELTLTMALIIIDFAEEEEKDDIIDLWNKQVEELKRGLGSY